MKPTLALILMVFGFTGLVQGEIYFYKSSDKEIPNDVIQSFVEQINSKLSIFTSLKPPCIDYYPISYKSDNSDGEFEMDLRERHDSLCGGDPDTSPTISNVFFRKHIDDEEFQIYLWHWLCGRLSIEKYVLVPYGECSDLRSNK